MINNKQCQFEPTTNTSSATICKWCGKEKWQHNTTMSNNKQSSVEEKEHLDWSKLTQEQKDEIIKLLVSGFVKIQKQAQEDFFKEMIYDIFTPFWVKWFRKLKKKIQGGNNEQQ